MITETGSMLKIRLEGDWSMSGVAEKYPPLSTFFAQLLESAASGEQQKDPSDAGPKIDLAGVTDFDACGCQLLALFIRALRQNGIGAQLTNIPDTFESRIHSLGFDCELNLPL